MIHKKMIPDHYYAALVDAINVIAGDTGKRKPSFCKNGHYNAAVIMWIIFIGIFIAKIDLYIVYTLVRRSKNCNYFFVNTSISIASTLNQFEHMVLLSKKC